MGYPIVPDIDFSYTGFQQSQGDNSFPGTELDNDLVALRDALLSTTAFIEESFQSDGSVKPSKFPDNIAAGPEGPPGPKGDPGLKGDPGTNGIDGTDILPLANTWSLLQTMAGGLALGSQKITSLGMPVVASDAASKAYVDSQVSGTFPHQNCACATTANITLSGEQTIDGILTSASRVLVKSQTLPANNGIYVSAAGAWARAVDMDAAAEVSGTVPVTGGTTQGNTIWGITAAVVTLGADPINFTKINSGSVITADGITIVQSGTMLSVGTVPLANVPDAAAKLYDPSVSGFGGPFVTLQNAVQVTLYATHLGMAGDDSTDNSTKFAQALSVLASMGGGRFVFDYDRRQAGTCVYRLGSPHVIMTNVEIEGQDGVAVRINHNAGVGLDFKGVLGNRTQHQVLRKLKLYDGGTRDGTHKLVRFQQAARFLITDCFFDATRDSLDWLETESGRIVNTIFWQCKGVDWSIGNSIDIWIFGVHHLGNVAPAGLSPISLGNGVEITNGVSGLKAFGWAIGRKYRGLYFGRRSGATDKTPEHVDIFGLVIDNCRDVGVQIDDLFNANFYGYFISSCGLIDAALGDPNGERRVGILMSAGPHADAPTKASTQTVRFHKGGWVTQNRRQGLVIQGTVASGRTMTPTDIGVHGEFGSNNQSDTVGIGHILVDGGDVNGLSFDAVTFKAADLKVTIPGGIPRSDHCIKFNGLATNTDIRLSNMTLGDTGTVTRMIGDISRNNGVVISGNNELFFTTWTPVLFFGGSAVSMAGTYVGRKRAANGLMTLEFEVTLTNNGTGTGAATITGVPENSLNDAVGDLRVLSGGLGLPAGTYCRININTIYLEYQGAAGSTALDHTHLTDTVNFVGSISYAMARP